MSQHDELLEAAKQGIANLFGDTSVEPSRTVESLRDLMGEIEVYLDGLAEDARALDGSRLDEG